MTWITPTELLNTANRGLIDASYSTIKHWIVNPSSPRDTGWMRRPVGIEKYLSGRVLGVYSLPEIRHRIRGCVCTPVTEHSISTFMPSCAVLSLGPVTITAPIYNERTEFSEMWYVEKKHASLERRYKSLVKCGMEMCAGLSGRPLYRLESIIWLRRHPLIHCYIQL